MPFQTQSATPAAPGSRRNDDTLALIEILDLYLVKTEDGQFTSGMFESVIMRDALDVVFGERLEIDENRPLMLSRTALAEFFTTLRATPARFARYKQGFEFVSLESLPKLMRASGPYCNGLSSGDTIAMHPRGTRCNRCSERSGSRREPAATKLRCASKAGGCGLELAIGEEECSFCLMPRDQLEAYAELVALADAEAARLPADVERVLAELQELTGTDAELAVAVILSAANLIERAWVTGGAGDAGRDIAAHVREKGEDGRPAKIRRVTIQVRGGKTRPGREPIQAHGNSPLVNLPERIQNRPWLVTFGCATKNTEMYAQTSRVPVRVIDGPELARLALAHNEPVPANAEQARKRLAQLNGTRP